MRTLAAQLRNVQDALDALARRHRVPGATLAVGVGDELFDFATGVLSVDTGVETTPNSVFQIGSNTKVFTATLVMQLVDSGQVDLDQPVRRYLKDFALADPTAAQEITVRQLLVHTSGIQGDYFQGFGRGDDAIEKYVASLAEIDLVHRPGQMWSYCNSGFVVAGRLAEVVSGKPFDQLLKENLCQPLGLERTTVLAEEMVAQRCAAGHVPGPGSNPVVPPVVLMQYGQAPAGTRTTATAAELVRFVQMHLHSGAGPNGDQVLSSAAVAAMQEVQVNKPLLSTSALAAQGLGWALQQWDGKRVIGHGGGTIGQLSFLQCVPEEQLVVALLTNSTTGGKVWLELGRWLFDELAGVEMARALEPPESPPHLNLARYTGTYERLGVRHVVSEDGDGLVVQLELTDVPDELRLAQLPPPVKLHPIDTERFGARHDGVDDVVAFLDLQRGRPSYLFSGGRVSPRATGRRPAATKRGAKQGDGRTGKAGRHTEGSQRRPSAAD
jgi:CubicO group peptidase (beta-lactamase class C family)